MDTVTHHGGGLAGGDERASRQRAGGDEKETKKVRFGIGWIGHKKSLESKLTKIYFERERKSKQARAGLLEF